MRVEMIADNDLPEEESRRVFGEALTDCRGTKMNDGKGWRLLSPSKGRGFKATLIKTFRVAGERVAIFRVLAPVKS
jgi:hypothetical protein